jgi:hypothetical protein
MRGTMTQFRILVLSAGVALAAGVAVAVAGTPFGGDDTARFRPTVRRGR